MALAVRGGGGVGGSASPFVPPDREQRGRINAYVQRCLDEGFFEAPLAGHPSSMIMIGKNIKAGLDAKVFLVFKDKGHPPKKLLYFNQTHCTLDERGAHKPGLDKHPCLGAGTYKHARLALTLEEPLERYAITTLYQRGRGEKGHLEEMRFAIAEARRHQRVSDIEGCVPLIASGWFKSTHKSSSQFYFVMPYYDRSLGTAMSSYRECSADLSRLRDYLPHFLLRSGKALAELHKRRFIQGDIKPANLLLKEGDACLDMTDFNLLKDLGDQTDFLASPEWRCDEESMGSDKQDVFALGASLAVALSGLSSGDFRKSCDRFADEAVEQEAARLSPGRGMRGLIVRRALHSCAKKGLSYGLPAISLLCEEIRGLGKVQPFQVLSQMYSRKVIEATLERVLEETLRIKVEFLSRIISEASLQPWVAELLLQMVCERGKERPTAKDVINACKKSLA